MADETLKPNIPDVSDAAPGNADAETKEKDGRIIIELDGTDADFLIFPSVKLADLKLDDSGNITVMTDPAPKAEESKEKAKLGNTSAGGVLTPFDRDIFCKKTGTGGGENLLDPLPENVFRYNTNRTGGIHAPVCMSGMTTIIYGDKPDNSERDGGVDMPTDTDAIGDDPSGETDPGDSYDPVKYGANDGMAQGESAEGPSAYGMNGGMAQGESVEGPSAYSLTDDHAPFTSYAAPELYPIDGELSVNVEENIVPLQASDDGNQLYVTDEIPKTDGDMAGEDLQKADELYYLLRSSDRRQAGRNAPGEPFSEPVPELSCDPDTEISGGEGDEPAEDERTKRLKRAGREPDFKLADGYVLTKKTDRRTLDRQRSNDVRCEVSRAEAHKYRAELALLESELSFGKKYASATDKALLRARRAELKAIRKELKLARKSASSKNNRYFKPILKASDIAASSLNSEATMLLIDRLEVLLARRDEINERLCELYTRTQKKKRGSLKGKTEYVKKHLRRARKKQLRLAKAIGKNSVPKADSVRLYELMDKYVRLSGRIKGIEYSLGKERAFGASARELRRDHKALCGELKALSKEINRVEIETIRRARANNRKSRGMLIGWSIVVLLAVLAAAVYVFREPLWELIRGWINWLFDILGWTHFGRL